MVIFTAENRYRQTGAFNSLHTGNTSVVNFVFFFFKKTHSDGIVTSAEELGDFKAAVPGMAVKEQAGQGQL